ncbi:helix-turn-helix transcriptional regulator [Chryseobacterium sp.]|uniref:AraC family transcriptional regulator n=1 Tax=Chryseobacterium sp. TaxID=1871047 RepID=UPI0025B99AEF|nr:helix-turn-helix transcriptional regulator [Chryseobacterium sp.]
MSHIITYPFKPISNQQQNLHIIPISERIKKGGQSVINPHRTDFYIIQLITKGKSSHMVDFQEVELSAGDILFLTPGQVHAFRENATFEGWLIAFPKDFFNQSSHDIYFLDNAHIFNNYYPVTKLAFKNNDLNVFIELIQKILDELQKAHDLFQESILHNYLSNLLLFSERKFILENNPSIHKTILTQDGMYVTQFKKMVRKSFRTETKVKYYANELFISERKLQKAVMAILGKSPKELINEQLILESKRLLIHESMSIKEVSYDLGFDEPSNFTKFFKNQTGISPTQFKEEKMISSI